MVTAKELIAICAVAGSWACVASASAQENASSPEVQGTASEERSSSTEEPAPEKRALQLALDGSYAASGASGLNYGGGAALRMGYVFPYKWAALVPEVGIDVYGFSGRDSAVLYGGFGGARARFGRGLEPGIFAHYGVTGVSWRDSFAAQTVDVGLSLDLTYFERLLLGVQGGYKSTISTGGNPAIAWYTAGLTVGTRL